MNNNVNSLNATENLGINGEDCSEKVKNNNSLVNNTRDNANVKESGSLKLCGVSTNLTSAIENNDNILLNKDPSLDGSNRSVADSPMEDNLSDNQQKENHEILKVTDDDIDFVKGRVLNDESQCDRKSNNVGLTEVGLGVHLKPQPIGCNFNIVPNPNEFGLVGKNDLSQANLDSLNISTNELLASDNSIVISNSNAIPQSDSIVSSNYSLTQLQQYMSDDDDDDDNSAIEELPAAPQQYREGRRQLEDSDDDSDSSTSSSTSILISDSSSDSESEDEYENFTNKPVCKPIKAKGEFDLNDLPPIEDLTISVPEEECIPIGKIYQIVEQLVIIQANKDTPAYDLDTVLFTQGGKPLGKVFDVMGPVTEPFYCIRFNSKDHIMEKNITLDQTVYAAPKTQYSKFVFLAQLMQLKGSDASWENDVEPPEIHLDYSDDEQEQRAKKKFYRNKKAAVITITDSDSDEPARKRHSAYVKRMNARNLRLTAARSNVNHRNRCENGNIMWQPSLPPMMAASPVPHRADAPCHQMFGRPPTFDMRVPMPNSPIPGHYQFHQAEPMVVPQVLIGPSTSQRSQGPPTFPPHCTTSGGPPFPQHCASPCGPLFSRHCASPGPPPFAQHCASPGPPPFSPQSPMFPQHCTSPRPIPYPRPCAPPGPAPYPGAVASPRPIPFPRPGPSYGPPPFHRPCSSSDGQGASAFPSPPPYGRLPNNQGLNSASPGWNSSFPKSENPWASNFPPPAPMRNAPPSPFGPFPFSMDFAGSGPVRGGAPQGPQPWPAQVNNQGSSPRLNPFTPFIPPPPPNFPHN